jgi:hypothetical protein
MGSNKTDMGTDVTMHRLVVGSVAVQVMPGRVRMRVHIFLFVPSLFFYFTVGGRGGWMVEWEKECGRSMLASRYRDTSRYTAKPVFDVNVCSYDFVR